MTGKPFRKGFNAVENLRGAPGRPTGLPWAAHKFTPYPGGRFSTCVICGKRQDHRNHWLTPKVWEGDNA